ncbi:DUF6670 family protein [Nocardia alba]|uniref:AttH domain-containing protein n=1 Tax=Nocardia alba TaxID=225051 RepID=A0A4R1FLK0_9NOCA|nr:DUF6670 family protein [Nocardia alba]TCJ95707.1 hypothetical protein DFR71_4622 [Nocardia alba]
MEHPTALSPALVPDRRSRILDRLTRPILDTVLPRIDSRVLASTRPFTTPEVMRPHAESRRWAWTHYGVFLPELPSPHRYLNTMTFIGATGALAFDNDYLAADDARDTATVLSSTAAEGQHHYRAYDAGRDCSFAADGSRLDWGRDLSITGAYPYFHVRGHYDEFDVSLDIRATDQVSWFVRTPLYDHLSLFATATGTLTDKTGTVAIEQTLCTFEYARCMSPQSLTAQVLPTQRKLPVDFFTYQIINLDSSTQVLLTEVRAAGAVACRLAHVRSLDGTTRVYDDVAMTVVSYRPKPLVDPRGRPMRVPRQLRWRVRDATGAQILILDAEVDSPLRYGHGRGYVGAYTYRGTWQGRSSVAGSGYMEWIDCESGQ